MMANGANGTSYVGVTFDPVRRVWEHREGAVEGPTRTHGLDRLVWFKRHDSIVEAIRREKAIKHWVRAWKARLVIRSNPGWVDLYESIL